MNRVAPEKNKLGGERGGMTCRIEGEREADGLEGENCTIEDGKSCM